MLNRSRKRVGRVVALAAAAVMIPSAAYAVSVTSAHGYGTQTRTASYGTGAQVGGGLTARSGYTVYYEGRVNVSGFGCSSPNIGRYAANVTSGRTEPRGGAITTPLGSCSLVGVSSRISRVIDNLPDPSGDWSANY